MTEADQKQQMQRLEARIDAAKARTAPKPRVDKTMDEGHLAWRMVIELVAGLMIGFGIGWALDWAFGTLPLFLVVFTLLGFAAGVKTVIRSANALQEKQVAKPAADDEGA
ncbi:MAG: AtpZ/AtpI family protein [Pseudomonadota bacterium]